jgi:mRNA interferase MazF
VIILSNDGFNLVAAWRSVIVIPLSASEGQALRGPTAVALPAGAGGLPRPSVALCHQITTLDRGKLAERAGHLGPAALAAVEEGLKAAVDLD